MSVKRTLDKAIKIVDAGQKMVEVKWDDGIGDTHRSYVKSVEEAKEFFDKKKFGTGVAWNAKIDGKLYKKHIQGR